MLILNGQELEPGAPETTLLNRSFKYGDGLFESIRVYNGKPLFLDDHFSRLVSGMKAFKYAFDPADFVAVLSREIKRILKINKIHAHGRLRLQVYRSGEGAYTPLSHKPYYLLEGYSLKTDYFSGTPALTLSGFRELSLTHSAFSQFKTCNSLPYVMAGIHAEEQGTDDAILFSNGFIAESSIANVFIVSNRKLATPSLNSGCLNGIMRSHVIQLAESLKIPCQEKKIKLKELLQADEVFLTNTLRGIMPVKQFEGTIWDTKNYGLTSFLQKCLVQYVDAKG